MRKNPHVRICGGLGSATTLVYPTARRGVGSSGNSATLDIKLTMPAYADPVDPARPSGARRASYTPPRLTAISAIATGLGSWKTCDEEISLCWEGVGV